MGVLDPWEEGGQGRGMASSYKLEGSLQTLIRSLRLAVSLGVKPQGKTGRGSQGSTESPPNLRGKLGPSIRHDIIGRPVGPEY